MARSGRLALAMLMVAIVLCTLACGDSSPSGAVTVQKPRPTLTPRIGMTWAKAPYVGRAEDLFPVDSNPSTGPDRPGTPGHPGHFPGQEIMADVASVGGRFVAVGYGGLRGEWTARVWTSADALTWTESTLDHTIGSFAVAIATTSDGHVIAVGRAGRLAMAWLSTDGMTWAAKPLGSATPDPAQRASAITVTDLGIIVGGSYGPELGARTAVFWRSVDGGNSWQGGPSDAIDDEVDLPTFDGAEVSAIARTADGLVAMGRLGTGQRWTGSLAWLSTDGVAWRRVDDAALGGGLAVSLVVTPDWILAVGSDADEREAVVWASPDGASWVRAAPETSLRREGPDDRCRCVGRRIRGRRELRRCAVRAGHELGFLRRFGLGASRGPAGVGPGRAVGTDRGRTGARVGRNVRRPGQLCSDDLAQSRAAMKLAVSGRRAPRGCRRRRAPASPARPPSPTGLGRS